MDKVTFDISMSLDGFITGPNVGVGNGMRDGGDRLHDWTFDAKTETDATIVEEIYEATGAVLMGKSHPSPRCRSSRPHSSWPVPPPATRTSAFGAARTS